MWTIQKCPCCGGTDFNPTPSTFAPFVSARVVGWHDGLGRNPPLPIPTRRLECRQCSHRMAELRWDASEEQRLYGDYRSSSYNRMRTLLEPSYAMIAGKPGNPELERKGRMSVLDRLLDEHVRPLIYPPRRVIDYGGGRGHFLPDARGEHGRHVYEPFCEAPESVLYAPEVEPLRTPGLFQGDLVFCQHVLEHVPDPLYTLQDVGELTAPGGYVVLIVPLEEPGQDIHEHVGWFTSQSLWALVTRAGALTPSFCQEVRVDYGWCEGAEIQLVARRSGNRGGP